MFPFPELVYSISVLSHVTRETHTRVINTTHTWTFLTKREGGTLCVWVCGGQMKRVNYEKRREIMALIWSASFPCCSSSKAQPPHVRQQHVDVNKPRLFYCWEPLGPNIKLFISRRRGSHTIDLSYKLVYLFKTKNHISLDAFISRIHVCLHVVNRRCKPAGQSQLSALRWRLLCAPRVPTTNMRNVLTSANVWSEKLVFNFTVVDKNIYVSAFNVSKMANTNLQFKTK